MPLYVPAIEPGTPDQINNVTDKPVPVGADLLLIEDSASGFDKKKILLSRVCPAATLAEATDTLTTSSGTDVLATGMTLTPEAGTYLVFFSGTISNGSSGGVTYASVYYNGTQIAASERFYYRGGNQQQNVPFCCVAKVTASGSLAIEGRWRTLGGSTGAMYQRTLSVVKVS